MQHDIDGGQHQQDGQRLAALAQRFHVGVQANGRKEVQQQRVEHGQLEDDAYAQHPVEQPDHGRAQKAADHGLGDAVVAHKADFAAEAAAHKHQHDGQRKALERGDQHNLGQRHDQSNS